MGGKVIDVTLIYGELEVWIFEAKSLPNMDLASERVRRCLNFVGTCPCLFRKDPQTGKQATITSDPYVSVCLSGATVAQTRIIANSENPLWNEHFCIQVCHPIQKVEFHVKDDDVLGAQHIGVVEIPVENLMETDEMIDDWFPIMGENCAKPYPQLHLSIKLNYMDDSLQQKEKICIDPFIGVPNTYFPLRKGGNVTLYQDAHVPEGQLPEIPLDDGKVYKQGQCWEDICHAILEAQNLIYIIGWSVYHPIRLVREPTKPLPAGGELTLGDLLKYKSQEGVRVVLLIWDDKTSHDKFLLKTEGVMQTHDEETKKFFKNSSVHCVLSPRYASNKLSIFKQQVVGTLFTHHQKCVLVDSPAPENKRKITAFIGGLDLCDGRYDTPEHRLFDDLDTVFEKDFHNPILPPNARGPREPWHDMHCKVEGPAAYDILTNFEQRWKQASKWSDSKIQKIAHWHDDALLRLDRISWILNPANGPDGDKSVQVTDDEDNESWHVQVFRSIDSGSVKGFPKDVKEAVAQNLTCLKNLQVDKSIHTAYVKAIRSAQHFIYIENQYFLGSSFFWLSYDNAGADNLIPMELAAKIVTKIRSKERFAVYIVIPMWPEGVPTSNAVQEILHWQTQTMDMMYMLIRKVIDAEGLSDEIKPNDYLNFFCLGKREAPSANASQQIQTDNRALAAAQKYRRFMIYVHAKGMIVDDEYVLMGSANINQRSLDGSRDTEIAMGAYQPRSTWATRKGHPHGQVYGYRMSLWAEHFGHLEDIFNEPQSLDCVKRVKEIAKSNWEAYVSEEYKEMKGHIMQYPLALTEDGVDSLQGFETFPDVGGDILGEPTTLPDVLTT